MLVPGTYCLACFAPDPRERRSQGRTILVCAACGSEAPRALIVDPAVRTEETPRGLKHWTAGALIERDGRFLLMQKQSWPYLWDVVAGHLGPGEEPEAAAAREVAEETGLTFRDSWLAYRGEIFPDPCRRGANLHEWHLFRGRADGDLRLDGREVRELRWVTRKEMFDLPFVRPAYVLFDAIRIWEEQ